MNHSTALARSLKKMRARTWCLNSGLPLMVLEHRFTAHAVLEQRFTAHMLACFFLRAFFVLARKHMNGKPLQRFTAICSLFLQI